jgi:hypothetical protein
MTNFIDKVLATEWGSYFTPYRVAFDLPENCEICCNICGEHFTGRIFYDKFEPQAMCEDCVINAYFQCNPDIEMYVYAEFDDPLASWLLRQIKQEFYHLEYSDNFRVSEVGDKDQERLYRQISQNGCCCSEDIVVEHPVSRQKYMIGCNWGH